MSECENERIVEMLLSFTQVLHSKLFLSGLSDVAKEEVGLVRRSERSHNNRFENTYIYKIKTRLRSPVVGLQRAKSGPSDEAREVGVRGLFHDPVKEKIPKQKAQLQKQKGFLFVGVIHFTRMSLTAIYQYFRLLKFFLFTELFNL